MPVRSKFTKAAPPQAGVLSKTDFLRLYVDEKRTVVQIAEAYGVIRESYKAGVSLRDLGRKYFIKPERVRQITIKKSTEGRTVKDVVSLWIK